MMMRRWSFIGLTVKFDGCGEIYRCGEFGLNDCMNDVLIVRYVFCTLLDLRYSSLLVKTCSYN